MSDAVEMTTLGKTGLKVSRLGVGLAEIGTLSDASVAGQLLNAALDGGIVFLDTAILGTRSPEHMRTNIKLVENELPLPAEVVQEPHRRFERLE